MAGFVGIRTHKFTRRSVWLAEVTNDRSLEPHDFADEMRQLVNRQVLAGADVHVNRVGIVVHQAHASVGAVVDMKKLTTRRARPPDDRAFVSADRKTSKSTNWQSRTGGSPTSEGLRQRSSRSNGPGSRTISESSATTCEGNHAAGQMIRFFEVSKRESREWAVRDGRIAQEAEITSYKLVAFCRPSGRIS